MSKVHHLERARGVHPRMLDLPRQWIARGPFEIAVALHGGLRADEALQAKLSGGGMSAAGSLIKTPHGRAAALDLVPIEFLLYVPVSFGGKARRWFGWDELPAELRAKFKEIGEFSEALGFEWGGRWLGKSFPNGDQPHHQLKGWTRLPFPAPAYAFPADLERHIAT
jgi:hypothetical protein